MDLWYTNLVLATLASFFLSESRDGLYPPCKYGPPWCSYLGGDSIRTTGFIVYTSKTHCTCLWIKTFTEQFIRDASLEVYSLNFTLSLIKGTACKERPPLELSRVRQGPFFWPSLSENIVYLRARSKRVDIGLAAAVLPPPAARVWMDFSGLPLLARASERMGGGRENSRQSLKQPVRGLVPSCRCAVRDWNTNALTTEIY